MAGNARSDVSSLCANYRNTLFYYYEGKSARHGKEEMGSRIKKRAELGKETEKSTRSDFTRRREAASVRKPIIEINTTHLKNLKKKEKKTPNSRHVKGTF